MERWICKKRHRKNMKKILDYLKKIFKNPTFILAVLLVIASIIAINQCSRANEAEAEKDAALIRNEKNMEIMYDSIRVVWNETSKQYESLKGTYEVESQNQLKIFDKLLAKEIKKLGKDIMDYIKVSSSINLGDTIIDNEVIKYKADKYGLKWDLSYDDGGFKQKITGTSKFRVAKNLKLTPAGTDIDIKIGSEGTNIDTNITSIKLGFAHREVKRDDKTYYEVVATSPSPKVTFDTLSSVYFIEKFPCEKISKVRRITLGPYVGIGLSSGPFQVGFRRAIQLKMV
jgi:hypothetical protein